MTPPAVIPLAFDPVVHFGDLEVRVQTLFLAGIVFAALLVAARIGRLTPQASPFVPPPTLRPDEIPFLVLGIVPGRGHRRADRVRPAPPGLLPGQPGCDRRPGAGEPRARARRRRAGSWEGWPSPGWSELRVIDGCTRRSLPVLFVLAAGKLVAVLAGDGQGLPSDARWATAFQGPGPWGSLAPEVPSHPSQLYEAIATTVVLAILGLILRLGAFARRDGSALLVAVALWAVGRGIAAMTWRDAAVVGPLKAEHLILAGLVGGCLGGLLWLRLPGRLDGSAGGPERRRPPVREGPARVGDGRGAVSFAETQRHPARPTRGSTDDPGRRAADPSIPSPSRDRQPLDRRPPGCRYVRPARSRLRPGHRERRPRGGLRLGCRGGCGRRRRQGRVPGMAGDVAVEADRDHVPRSGTSSRPTGRSSPRS